MDDITCVPDYVWVMSVTKCIDKRQSGKKPSGQQSQKGYSRYPKITAEVQARFRQKSKVASQARVNTQVDRVRYRQGSGKNSRSKKQAERSVHR